MFSNRRPYYGLKLSIADFFREPVRYLKQSNTQESMMEKPYLVGEYPKMHLSLPDFKYKPKKRPGFLGPIADGVPPGGFAFIDYGEARCYWNTPSTSYCVEGPVVITLLAEHFWSAEFEFNISASGDTGDIAIERLPETKATAWDEQDYLLTFPENYNGIISICGSASTHTLVSQTFETVVAGMPVSLHFIGGSVVLMEKGQQKPATLLRSSYGTKGDNCGCIEISSSCIPPDPGSIGYTTQQMQADEVQDLIVTNPNPDYTYNWSISSGGGTLSSSTGTSVSYTAPSTNAECADNPTITLSVDSVVVDTINLAVNAYTGDEWALYAKGTGCPSVVPYGGSLCGDYVCGNPYCWQCCLDKTTCDGVVGEQSYSTSCVGNNPDSCGEDWCGTYCTDTSVEDKRTAAMITQGCCPSGLL